MKKFIVSAAVMEATGFRYIPLRECESYEDAEIAYKAYKRRNPGLSVLIEHVLREETPVTNFQRITRSPEALDAFLRSLSVLSAPWDDAFHSRVSRGSLTSGTVRYARSGTATFSRQTVAGFAPSRVKTGGGISGRTPTRASTVKLCSIASISTTSETPEPPPWISTRKNGPRRKIPIGKAYSVP